MNHILLINQQLRAIAQTFKVYNQCEIINNQTQKPLAVYLLEYF